MKVSCRGYLGDEELVPTSGKYEFTASEYFVWGWWMVEGLSSHAISFEFNQEFKITHLTQHICRFSLLTLSLGTVILCIVYTLSHVE
jgi:hypothetical protein